MDPQKITELANLLRNNGDKILNSEFNFTLSGSLLRALNDSFTLIADATDIGPSQTFQVVNSINSKSSVFRDLQLVHDFVQKTAFLCIIRYPGDDDYTAGNIDITKFRSLKRLEVKKINIKQIVGIQPLRGQIQHLICVKSLQSVDDIITHCGGDKANGFVWNELKIADFSYNQLQSVDTALEFAQYLQHLNLRHNQLVSVEAIKWLPNLKTLDLSFNRLSCIPQLHLEACKRLQILTMSNNLIEDLLGLSKLDALTDLDLSDNCLLDHSYLLPLSAIVTLKFLNLYGNPLHCHPKHRLATAQFLHKNTSTVKFILDYEPLSKSERAVTGSQQLRRQPNNAYNRYSSSKGFITIGSTSSRSSNSALETPASSLGSLRSFKLESAAANGTAAAPKTPSSTALIVDNASTKKRAAKVRNVEIAEVVDGNGVGSAVESADKTADTQDVDQQQSLMSKSMHTSITMEASTEHLETKRHIETLRSKYGNEWLQSENADMMMHSVLGIENFENSQYTTQEQRNKSRQLFQDYLGEFSATAEPPNSAATFINVQTSTPTTAGAYLQSLNQHADSINTTSPQKTSVATTGTSLATTTYLSMDGNSNASDNPANGSNATTPYKTANASDLTENVQPKNADGGDALEKEAAVSDVAETEVEDDMTAHLKNVYSSTVDEEPEISEAEDDEETYIVYPNQSNVALFLTISSNFLREKDTLTQRTKNKWSLKILESCDRIKSNTLRINFDTVKLDKQERVYTIEDGLCQELEKKLRDILSQRDLREMNQTIYRCVNCTSQFSRENRKYQSSEAIRCPNCKSNFVAEIHDIPKSLEKTIIRNSTKVSPAAMVLPSEVAANVAKLAKETADAAAEDTNSIGGKGASRLSAINTQKSSAHSLNGSSSCSKISNSHSSFDSNQSVVGSSNTEREAAVADFKFPYESDIDVISNPSMSSIEVLDSRHASRKTSEERRILQVPSLETIEDQSFTQPFIMSGGGGGGEGGVGALINNQKSKINSHAAAQTTNGSKHNKSGALAHFTLTESSSSGSITDSICTAYEQQQQQQQKLQQTNQALMNTSAEEQQQQAGILDNFLQAENNRIYAQGNGIHNANNSLKKEDTSISSMFGALFQSTNILMSSSKKLLDAESNASIQAGIIGPQISPNKASYSTAYKFNFTDFNDIDHRLKLYFYQTKFDEAGERFKWLARGHIYNSNTQAHFPGIVVMSTCKVYIMEAFAKENDDVTKWLRQVASVTVDRLENIQLLPWKVGLSFQLRDWGGFLLLLQDILRTDSILLYFANNSLPKQCVLNYQISDQIVRRLNNAAVDEKIKMLSLLNGCEIKCENARRELKCCALITTDTRLYLTSDNLDWLYAPPHQSESADSANNEIDIEVCITQFMSNLVEVERPEENVFTINFLDETQDKYELWKCAFETKENAESCFQAIGQSWEILFGVPLFTTVPE